MGSNAFLFIDMLSIEKESILSLSCDDFILQEVDRVKRGAGSDMEPLLSAHSSEGKKT